MTASLDSAMQQKDHCVLAPSHPLIWCNSEKKKKTSLVAQTVKRLLKMRETQVQSLGWEDPLEKEMATHSGTLAWKIPWMEEPGRLQSMGSQRVRHNWATSLSLSRLKKIINSFLNLSFYTHEMTEFHQEQQKNNLYPSSLSPKHNSLSQACMCSLIQHFGLT